MTFAVEKEAAAGAEQVMLIGEFTRVATGRAETHEERRVQSHPQSADRRPGLLRILLPTLDHLSIITILGELRNEPSKLPHTNISYHTTTENHVIVLELFGCKLNSFVSVTSYCIQTLSLCINLISHIIPNLCW